MDWRHPNVKCLFHVEKTGPDSRGSKRFVKAIHNPMDYGLSTAADYLRKQNPHSWPPGTEYQYAFCSQYRDNLPGGKNFKDTEAEVEMEAMAMRQHTEELQMLEQRKKKPLPPIDCDKMRGVPIYRLYDPSPLPLMDKHYRGARYHINDPVGVYVPDELKKTKETDRGPVKLSTKEDLENIYTPNYRYKDWVERPLPRLVRDLESNWLVCKLPAAHTEHYDLYCARLGRGKKEMQHTQPLYQPCRLLPIPIDKDLPNQPQGGENMARFNELQCKKARPPPQVVRC